MGQHYVMGSLPMAAQQRQQDVTCLELQKLAKNLPQQHPLALSTLNGVLPISVVQEEWVCYYGNLT